VKKPSLIKEGNTQVEIFSSEAWFAKLGSASTLSKGRWILIFNKKPSGFNLEGFFFKTL
jgi:hypothetical protein